MKMKYNRAGRARSASVFRILLFLLLTGYGCTACLSRFPADREYANRTLPSRLVAAGMLRGDMKARSNLVNDLRIVKVASGQMTITFNGYRMPDKSGQPKYIVKAVASRAGGMVLPVTTVDSYTEEGVVLRITDPAGKVPLPLKYLVELEFSIEVKEPVPR